MSSHADTIRAYLDQSGCMDEPPPHDALDALLAENQQLREALERTEKSLASAREYARQLAAVGDE